MARAIGVLVIVLLVQANIWACEGCGCSISSNGVGLVSAYQFNTIGMRWNMTPFRSKVSEFGGGTFDDFHTLEFRLQYHLSPKIRLGLFQPYKINVRDDYNGSRALDGFSDTRIVANYSLLNNLKIGKASKIYLELGAGLKLPVGKYDKDLHEQDFPENFNPGNGSLGTIFQGNLVYTRKQFGLLLNAFTLLNGKTKEGYQFGNQFSSNLLLFWQQALNEKWQLTPYGGLSLEKVARDYNQDQREVQSTSGDGKFLTLGFNLKYDRWMLGTSWSKPLSQSYSDDLVIAKNRLSLELSFIF